MNKAPLCVSCGKPLRRYRYRAEAWAAGEWGGYGDGHFCGLNCGYRWALMYLKEHAEYAERLHQSIIDVMQKRELDTKT